MLARRDGTARPSLRPTPDPVAGVSAGLLGLLALGLFAAAIGATYGYVLPAVETPMVGSLAALFGLVVLLNLVALTARRLRSRGR
jgi:uncharacterized membrane protein YhaH (DUF805 family)